MQRLQRDHQLRCRAVRVGYNVLALVAINGVRVHLWNDQRHIGVHAEQRTVVNDYATCSGGYGRKLLGRFRTDGKNRHVPSGPVEILDILNLQHFVGIAIFDLDALASRRGQHGDFIGRKFALGENVDDLAPDIARRASHYNSITHCLFLRFGH
jgi:hypothetical protein